MFWVCLYCSQILQYTFVKLYLGVQAPKNGMSDWTKLRNPVSEPGFINGNPVSEPGFMNGNPVFKSGFMNDTLYLNQVFLKETLYLNQVLLMKTLYLNQVLWMKPCIWTRFYEWKRQQFLRNNIFVE